MRHNWCQPFWIYCLVIEESFKKIQKLFQFINHIPLWPFNNNILVKFTIYNVIIIIRLNIILNNVFWMSKKSIISYQKHLNPPLSYPHIIFNIYVTYGRTCQPGQHICISIPISYLNKHKSNFIFKLKYFKFFSNVNCQDRHFWFWIYFFFGSIAEKKTKKKELNTFIYAITITWSYQLIIQ